MNSASSVQNSMVDPVDPYFCYLYRVTFEDRCQLLLKLLLMSASRKEHQVSAIDHFEAVFHQHGFEKSANIGFDKDDCYALDIRYLT